jgi:hypothetical protein
VSRVAGTQSTTTTLDNRSGAGIQGAGQLLLDDVLVTSGGVLAANVRDRRPWSRGAASMREVTGSNASQTKTGASAMSAITTTAGTLAQRVECSGNPIELHLEGAGATGASAAYYFTFAVFKDGTEVPFTRKTVEIPTGGVLVSQLDLTWHIGSPVAGSHLWEIYWEVLGGGWVVTIGVQTGDGAPVTSRNFLRLSIREQPRPNANNGTA